MDETTPHLHFDFTPIVGHSLSSKKIMPRSFLRSLHDELPLYLQKQGFDVERGKHEPERSGEKNKSLRQYKQDMEQQKQTLGKQLQALQGLKQQLQGENYRIAERLVEQVKSRGHSR